ncbi:MAG: hypothetical protein IJ527_09785 [Prevotella sp.]|nr:hypothetical protein [Prevotella sp.]
MTQTTDKSPWCSEALRRALQTTVPVLLIFIMTGCSSYMKLDKDASHYIYYQREHYTFVLDKAEVVEHIKKEDKWLGASYTKHDIDEITHRIIAMDSLVIKEYPIVPPVYENYEGDVDIHDLVADCIKPLFKKKRVVVYNNYTKQYEQGYYWEDKRWFIEQAGEEHGSFTVRLLKNGNIVYSLW